MVKQDTINVINGQNYSAEFDCINFKTAGSELHLKKRVIQAVSICREVLALTRCNPHFYILHTDILQKGLALQGFTRIFLVGSWDMELQNQRSSMQSCTVKWVYCNGLTLILKSSIIAKLLN